MHHQQGVGEGFRPRWSPRMQATDRLVVGEKDVRPVGYWSDKDGHLV